MSRTKKFFYNSISACIFQIVTMVMGFIIPRILLKVYGSEINGLVSSILQFIAYFALVEAGLGGSAIYAMYKPLAEQNHKSISAIVNAARNFYRFSGYIFAILTIGLAIVYPIFIKTEMLMPVEVGILVFLLGTSGTIDFFVLSKYRVLLTADQKLYIISIASTITLIVNTIIIIICAHYKLHIVLLRLFALSGIFLRSIMLWLYVKKNYSFLNYKEPPDNSSLSKRWDVVYLQVLGSIQTGAPIVLATIFTSLKMVSVYAIFNMVMSGISGIVGIFAGGLSASFGDVIARNDQYVLQKAYKEFEFIYYLLISIIYSITLVMIMPFIRIYTEGITDVNYDLPLIGLLLTINGLLHNIKTPQGMLVISAGLYKETRIQTSIQGFITVIVGISLSPVFGLVGVVIGPILSNIYRIIDLLFFIPKNVTKLPVSGTMYRIIRIFASVILTSFALLFIDNNPQNYLEFFKSAIATSIWSVFIVMIIGVLFDRREFMNVLVRVRSLLGLSK